MRGNMLLSLLLCGVICVKDVAAIKCLTCSEREINGMLSAGDIPCNADNATSVNCAEDVVECITFCYHITGMDDADEMELFEKQSGCKSTFDLPAGVTPITGECQSFPETNASTAFAPGDAWNDLESQYANACSCTSDDCNLADMTKCPAFVNHCVGDKACKHGEACGGTESKPECECDKYYEGDQCEKAFTRPTHTLSTGDDCLNSCSGKKDGLYQSCATCTKYINCTESVLTEVACTTDMEWDNKEQKCLSESTTCEMSTGSASTLAAVEFWTFLIGVFIHYHN